MLLSINPRYVAGAPITHIYFRIVDSDFTETFCYDTATFTGKQSAHSALNTIIAELAIIDIYGKKSLPIAANIARSYQYFWKNKAPNYRLTQAQTYSEVLDSLFPELNYSRQYLPCVLNQIKQLSFWRIDHLHPTC